MCRVLDEGGVDEEINFGYSRVGCYSRFIFRPSLPGGGHSIPKCIYNEHIYNKLDLRVRQTEA